MEPIDHQDLKILELLQQNNMLSQQEIGDKISLSAPAVQRRIKRLREIGAIQKDVSIVNPEFLGSPITIIAEIEMETDKIELIDKTKAAFLKEPQVQQCYYVTGEADFILIILVYTMKEYEALTHRLFFKNPGIKRFNTFVSMDTVKAELAIPLSNRES